MSDRLYDPHGGHGGHGGYEQSSSTQQGGMSTIERAQEEINRAQAQARETANALSQRGENLDTLQHKSDGVRDRAAMFQRKANSTRRDMWWKDMKMRICIIVGIIVLLVVIIVPSVIATKNKG